MKSAIKGLILVSLIILSATIVATANADSWPNLPPGQVTMSVADGSATTLDVTLSVVPSGYSVTNGIYPGWCSDRDHNIDGFPTTYQVYLYATLGSSLPASVASINWNGVNYVLNHKQGSVSQIQDAIWYFTNNFSPLASETDAWAMINGALANPLFQPGPGGILAVICLTQDWLTTPNAFSTQPVLIELQVPQTSAIVTLLSSSAITLGGSVTDTATVTPAGASGQVRFEVSTDAITFVQFGALKTLSGGNPNTATSDSYTPAAAGTYYFRAIYLGDSNYPSAQSEDLAELLVVNQATPAVVTVLSKSCIDLGDSVTDSVTVTGLGAGFPAPTGTVNFQVSTDNAATWNNFGAAKTLVAGSATSDSYTPAAAGTYYFRAVYSGDANYKPYQSGDKDEPLTVETVKKNSCTYTKLSDCSINLGDSVKDYAYVTSGATGQVRFEVSTDGVNFVQFGAVKTLPGGLLNVVVSDSYTPSALGTYYFRAVYLGDSKYLGSQSGDKDEPLTVSKKTTCTKTCLSASSITLGQSVTDKATVTPAGATGQVRFEVSTDGVNFVQFGALKTLSGGSATSDSYTPAAVGTYYFRAVYLGDANYLGSQSGKKDEPLCVKPSKKPSCVTTCLSACTITLGKTVTDTAYVTKGATGKVRFEVSTDGVNFVQFGAVKTLASGSNSVKSDAYKPAKVGTYYFRAVYLGDANYLGSQSGNKDEPLVVKKC